MSLNVDTNIEDVPRLPDGQPVFIDDDYFASDSESELMQSAPTLDSALLMRYLPAGPGGVIIHVQLLEDDDKPIKQRRPQPLPEYYSKFMDKVVPLPDGRYAYSGAGINGWPALSCMVVRSITAKAKTSSQKSPRLGRLMGKKPEVVRVWDAADRRSEATKAAAGQSPNEALEDFREDSIMGRKQYEFRVTLRCAPWTLQGWSKRYPGCVWWYEKESRPLPLANQLGRVLHGTGMVELADEIDEDPECVHAYLLHHRYALPGGRKETAKDRLTYHSLVVVEWKHSDREEHSFTVIELATLNGCGGRQGRANWHEDKHADVTALYQAMPDRMKAPWDGTRAEIRCHDIPASSFDDFKAHVAKYTGVMGRFLDPQFTHDHAVRLTYRKKKDIQRYLLNYMGRDYRYSMRTRNCQTFATDFYSFICGKKGMTPFSALSGVDFVSRTHLFLYDPSYYDNPIEKK